MQSDKALENWLKIWQASPDLEFDQGNKGNLLIRNFLGLGIERNAEILFPLCGKAKSMFSLAEYGYRIAGIEISPVAISRFFSDHVLGVVQGLENGTPVYIAEALPIKIYCGDLFKGVRLQCEAFFDVAALVAVLPEQREQYIDTLCSMLAPKAKGIVAVVHYDGLASTAPFPVSAQAFHALFSERFDITELEKYEAKVHPMHPLASQRLDGVIYGVQLK